MNRPTMPGRKSQTTSRRRIWDDDEEDMAPQRRGDETGPLSRSSTSDDELNSDDSSSGSWRRPSSRNVGFRGLVDRLRIEKENNVVPQFGLAGKSLCRVCYDLDEVAFKHHVYFRRPFDCFLPGWKGKLPGEVRREKITASPDCRTCAMIVAAVYQFRTKNGIDLVHDWMDLRITATAEDGLIISASILHLELYSQSSKSIEPFFFHIANIIVLF